MAHAETGCDWPSQLVGSFACCAAHRSRARPAPRPRASLATATCNTCNDRSRKRKTRKPITLSCMLPLWATGLLQPQGWDRSASQGGSTQKCSFWYSDRLWMTANAKYLRLRERGNKQNLQVRTGQSFFAFCIKSVSLYPLLLLTRPMKSSIR